MGMEVRVCGKSKEGRWDVTRERVVCESLYDEPDTWFDDLYKCCCCRNYWSWSAGYTNSINKCGYDGVSTQSDVSLLTAADCASQKYIIDDLVYGGGGSCNGGSSAWVRNTCYAEHNLAYYSNENLLTAAQVSSSYTRVSILSVIGAVRLSPDY